MQSKNSPGMNQNFLFPMKFKFTLDRRKPEGNLCYRLMRYNNGANTGLGAEICDS